MSIALTCPVCGFSKSAPDNIKGQYVCCPKCNERFVVPNGPARTAHRSTPPPVPNGHGKSPWSKTRKRLLISVVAGMLIATVAVGSIVYARHRKTEALFEQGMQALEKKDYDVALVCLEQAIARGKQGSEAFNARGRAHLGKGQDEAAITDFSEAIQQNPVYSMAYNNRANAYVNLKDYTKATSDYEHAIQFDPNNAKAFYNRGRARQQTDALAGAIEDYSHALKIDPQMALAYSQRAGCYLTLNKQDAAVDDARNAIRLDDSDGFPHCVLGSTLASAGRKREALAEFQEAKRLSPELAERVQQLEILQEVLP